MSSDLRVYIKADVRGVTKKFFVLGDGFKRNRRQILRTIGKGMERIMRSVLREKKIKKSGKLIESVKYEVTGTNQISISPRVKYARFPDVGAKGSKGRYVPTIGKRLVNTKFSKGYLGWHPGQVGRYYSKATVERASREIPDVIRVWMRRHGGWK